MSNLQTYYHFKIDFQKVDQHGTKRRKDNQSQSLKLPWNSSAIKIPMIVTTIMMKIMIPICHRCPEIKCGAQYPETNANCIIWKISPDTLTSKIGFG